MLPHVLIKSRKFEVCSFLSCSAVEFHWADIVKIVACQYDETLRVEQVQAMDRSVKV